MAEYDRSAVQIDENKLDKECIRLPNDYLKAAHASADAKHVVAELKAAFDVIKSDLAKEIRSTPEDYGLDKVTEAGISAVIVTHPTYKKAQARLINAEHEADLANAVVWAMEHKKRALSLLVDLHGMGYFSNVKMSAEGKEAIEEQMRQRVRRKHQQGDE